MNKFAIINRQGVSIEALETGSAEGKPVFFIHGTPGSMNMYGPQVEGAEKLGIRLLSYSRPGYGNSTRSEGRSVKDAASDVADIADFLGIEKFAVWGHSGGGPHALACAALLPERVTAAATLASVAPYGVQDLDFFSGMGEYNIVDFKLLQSDPAQWEKNNIEDVKAMITAKKEEALESISSLLSEVDRKSLSEELLDYLIEGTKLGCSKNVNGLMDDNLAFMKPWGFDPAAIKVPLQIWHGREDLFVPFSHGEWLGRNIAGAEKHFFEKEGHLSLFAKKNYEIQKWLSSYL